MAHLGGIGHRILRPRPKSRRLESQEVNTGSGHQFSVAEESNNQTETAFHFIELSQDAQKRHPSIIRPIDVEECRTDENTLDQFVIRCGHHTATVVLRNDATLKKANVVRYIPPLVDHAQWSPLGSYLLEMTTDTVVILGGKFNSFPLIMRYSHPMVELVDFSPGEKYLVTYRRPEPSNPKELWLKIFDVRTGRIMSGADGHVVDAPWPVIRWAGGKDDKYFATLRKNTVSVYEIETFSLLGKTPVNFDDVVDMSWSPTEPILALLKGGGKQPTKVVLVQIPDKVELMQKDIFSVGDCKMYWQSNGKYLAVKVSRHGYSLFELLRIKEEGITIEVLEVDEEILAFAWEPSGHRFAMIHGDQSKPNVSFYSMETPQNPGEVSKLATCDNKVADTLFWSPRGKHIVLAGLKGCFDGQLEFFDVDKLATMDTAQHPMATDISWDPTGRCIATAVTISQEINESNKPGFNGFNMWSFNGKFLYWEETEYPLLQLDWRPYGGGIIDDENHEMLKNLKKPSKKVKKVKKNVRW